ncbi:hypothetical protein HZ326_2471 [Fusarium oxysporum f. sp. albedinis]|nr:hypothetical protein HZ326_2471 [Fusarium oxysporum f. sp. albedinis]
MQITLKCLEPNPAKTPAIICSIQSQKVKRESWLFPQRLMGLAMPWLLGRMGEKKKWTLAVEDLLPAAPPTLNKQGAEDLRKGSKKEKGEKSRNKKQEARSRRRTDPIPRLVNQGI